MNCDKKNTELAQKILAYSRRRITSLCPPLLPAVHALRERIRKEPGPMYTDGASLWYWPDEVLEEFHRDHDLPAKRLLHMTLHCLLGHLPMRRDLPETELPPLFEAFLPLAERRHRAMHVFDAVADFKVNHWMRLLCGDDFSHPPSYYVEWEKPFPRLYREMLADPEYLWHLSHAGARQVALDDHEAWNRKTSPALAAGLECSDDSRPGPDWQQFLRQFAEQAQSSPQWGHLAGGIVSELRLGEESPISYTQFLRRFATPEERLLSDPDSIDSRWYHLGLELYGDIPLLEPTELSEPPTPDGLVLAIDTSGSCDGEVCRRLLRETAGLLRDIAAGAVSFHVLLLQCDAEIQQEFLLTAPDQLAMLAEEFQPQGFGGTDFTPVFQRVEELRRDGALPRVRGLLYLSDGCGTFPEAAPDYPVCFLIPEDGDCFGFLDIPPWVTTVQLNSDDFTVKEASL